MANDLKLYQGTYEISYRTSRNINGIFNHGCSHFFVGTSSEDVLNQQSKTLDDLRKEYQGKVASWNQTINNGEVFKEINPHLSLREVSVPGFKISLEKLADSSDK
jgi:hypothetical protein